MSQQLLPFFFVSLVIYIAIFWKKQPFGRKSEFSFFLMTSTFTVVMDDGDDANELESFASHKEALDYLKQQVHDWNHTDKWDKTKDRLEMVIAENGLELELIEETLSSDYEYHETWNSIHGWSGDSQ